MGGGLRKPRITANSGWGGGRPTVVNYAVFAVKALPGRKILNKFATEPDSGW
jgi:hypothetical protein